MKEKFKLFWGGEYSQWFMGGRFYDPNLDLTFTSTEQYMMYNKAILFDDIKSANAILKSQKPKEQEKLGRLVKDFDEEAWTDCCLDIVTRGNFLKFSQNRTLLKLMLDDHKAGYTHYVEASPFDRIWGIGLGEDDPDCLDRDSWRGFNWLGLCLDDVREKILDIYRSL